MFSGESRKLVLDVAGVGGSQNISHNKNSSDFTYSCISKRYKIIFI